MSELPVDRLPRVSGPSLDADVIGVRQDRLLLPDRGAATVVGDTTFLPSDRRFPHPLDGAGERVPGPDGGRSPGPVHPAAGQVLQGTHHRPGNGGVGGCTLPAIRYQH